jgi:peptide/nickel transport system permease protein
MIQYIGRRLAWAVVVLAAVGVATFVLAYIAPADPARAIAGRNASAESVERIRVALGLHLSLPEQLLGYFGRLLHGDLGHSFKKDRAVLDLIVARLPATILLSLAGLTVALAVGIPTGIRAAAHPGSRADRIATVLMAALIAAPSFWLGYVLLYVLAFLPSTRLGMDLFPLGGTSLLDPRYLFLPAVTLGLGVAGLYARVTRTAMLEELGRDYVRTARAKGAGERRTVWRHAFRNALPPILTQIGLDLGFFLGGVVVIEQVFGWNGIGKLAIDAVSSEDLPVLMGTVLFATFCIVIANLVVDVIYGIVDPRVRFTGR